ncbi:MAG: protein-L-isoaspartate(D-aspartate) O-methyltransferase [Phototrophicaceae bacterium]
MLDKLYFKKQREAMVKQQLVDRHITDTRVLQAMLRVPRHLFVPSSLRPIAYTDRPLMIGNGQTISQPYVVATMSQWLALQGTESVLEIGTGSGYQTAILCELAKRVISIERFADLAGKAGQVLERLGYDNVEIHVGDGSQGLSDMAPFDVIIVTAAAPALPEPLRLQMNPNGGRMVVPIGTRNNQRLELITRVGARWAIDSLLEVRFVPLIGQHGFADTPPPVET